MEMKKSARVDERRKPNGNVQRKRHRRKRGKKLLHVQLVHGYTITPISPSSSWWSYTYICVFAFLIVKLSFFYNTFLLFKLPCTVNDRFPPHVASSCLWAHPRVVEIDWKLSLRFFCGRIIKFSSKSQSPVSFGAELIRGSEPLTSRKWATEKKTIFYQELRVSKKNMSSLFRLN